MLGLTKKRYSKSVDNNNNETKKVVMIVNGETK